MMKRIMTLTIVLLMISAYLPAIAAPAPPILINPPNVTTQTYRYVTFSWNPSAGATKYDLQYSTSSSFSSSYTTTIKDITNTAYTVASPLANCTTYYWRVRAYDTYWGSYSVSWSFNVSETPSQPTLTAPKDAVRVPSKRPTLYWTSSSSYTYDIEVATNISFTSIIVSAPWVTTTQYDKWPFDLSEGATYWWRVRSIACSTTKSSWAGPRSFIIDLNNVLTKSPEDGETVSDNTPTFEWGSVDQATKYKIQVARDSSFTTLLFTQETTLTSFTPTPQLGDGTYYWHVQSYRNGAWTGVWGQTSSFIVNTGAGLGEPTGLVPTNGITVTFPLTMQWNAVTNAYSYTVQYSKSATLSSGNTEVTIFGVSYGISGTLADGRWYWRVRANNSQGQSGPWSEIENFNVGLPVPVINSPDAPPNGSIQSSPNVTFDWDDPLSPPSGYTMQYYTLQYSTSNTFSPQSTIQLKTNLMSRYPTTGTITISDSTYYWHVKSTWKRDSDQTFHESGWSDTYSFTISSAPAGVPTLTSPISGVIINTVMPELKWSTVSGSNITGYKLRYRKSSSNPGDPSNWTAGTYTEITIAGQDKSSYIPPALAESTTTESYWWSVATVDTLGMTGQFAYPVSFKVDVTPPDGSRITLVQPLGNILDSGTPTFSWKVPLSTPPVYGDVSSWILEYATNASFTENVKILKDLTTLPSTISGPDVIVSYTVPSTSPMANGVYFWHVAAFDAAGNKSQYSSIGSFTVQTTAPPQTKVTLISPTNGATNVSARPTFMWNALAVSGTTYTLQVSDSASDFTGTHKKIEQIGLAATSFAATSDLTSGVYYWHVNSTVANAQWSDTWVFTTGAVPTPTKVILTAPANNATNQSTTPQFSWQQLSGATSYALLVSDSSTDFTSTHLKVNKTGLVTTTWGTSTDWSSNTPTTLSNGTYWWKVTSSVANSDSDVWSFTVGVTTGNTVVITAQTACGTTAIPGASVVLSSSTYTSASVTTDANGVATIQNVPNGTYTLTVTATAYDNYTESVTVSGQVTKTVSLLTAGNGIIATTVYFDDVQHAASNITVRIYEQTTGNPAQTVVTNASGEFCALVARNMTYYIVVENYTDQKREGVTPSTNTTQKETIQPIVIESKGSITGVVADQDENVVQDAKVTVRDEKGQFVSSVQTDNKGQFNFKVLPGKYYVEVSKFGYITHTSSMFSVQFKQTYELGLIKLTSDKGTLIVNLSDKETGDALDGTVAVQDASGRVLTSVSVSNGVGSVEILADTYTLIARSPGYEDTPASVKVEGGKQASISITLGRAMGIIRVSVTETVEGKDQPVANADVYIDGEKAGATDENGIFSKGGFEPDTSHSVKVGKEGYGTSDSQQVTSKAGETADLSFTLKKSSPIIKYLLYALVAIIVLAIIGFVGYKFMSKGAKEEEVAEEEEARPQIRRPKPGERRGGLPEKSYK